MLAIYLASLDILKAIHISNQSVCESPDFSQAERYRTNISGYTYGLRLFGITYIRLAVFV